ncbi:sugar phosphate isomerase/epimerase [Metabacillus idriensis]|uniref:sugar phosphate isomerase/epimerase family protein n=1 Tax=Metabacillus idriensis TaxID=324768 RepID=UPI002813D106|nr:sugar phosphate isomerase/epimerase [Metabacillus idriensis]MDR0138638.1 sugar phosphate isomerase/epimerase [Metabacillus idriensis]
MEILGFSTGMYGWTEKYWSDSKNEPLWKEIFRDCAASGMDAVEIDPSPRLINLAESYGLSVSGSYLGLPLHEKNLDFEDLIRSHADRLSEAGGRDLLINADPKGGWGVALKKSEDEFKRQGEYLTRIASIGREFDIKVSMHNHADEVHNAEGDLRSVIEYASSEVGLCIDTGWAFTAGYSPVNWVRDYPERITAFHLRNQRGSVPTEDLTDGEIDMRGLLNALHEIKYSGWLTFELWHREDTHPKRTLAEDTRLSIEYLKKFMLDLEKEKL